MAYVDPIDINLFNLGDLGTFQSRDITESIVDFNVSLSLSGSSQVGVAVIDPGFTYAKSNYFQIRRDIFYRNMWFEISAVETQRSGAVHPLYNLECRSKAVQLMKRDKKPEAYRGMRAYDFAYAVAKRFNLNFVGEQTTKKQSIVKGKSRNSDDSVWTVLQSLASEQKFICFESEGTLFFCSEQFLLGKWGDPNFSYGQFYFIPFHYPESDDPAFASVKDKYVLLEQPQLRRSDDDIKAASGSMLVDRFNGVNLRPGMTIYLGGIPDFESFYLITDVTFSEGTPEPVQVQFRVPVDPTKENISTSTSSSSSTTAGRTGGNPIGTPPGGNTSRPPASITAQGSRKYTTEALGYMRYKGSRSSVISQAVYDAVRSLLEHETRAEVVLQQIRGNTSLNKSEKEIVEKIYAMYTTGQPAKVLGVAGGVSQTAVNQRLLDLEARYDRVATNVTPSASTSPIISSPKPAQGNINLVNSYIDDFIERRARNYVQVSSSRSSLDSAKNLSKSRAKAIFNDLPTKQSKISEMKRLSKLWSKPTDQVKYDALRQARVLSILIPGYTNSDGIPPSYK